MSITDLVSNVILSFISYLSTVWTYFSTHWWLGLLFISYQLIVWHNKQSIDKVNVADNGNKKRSRNIIEVATKMLRGLRGKLKL